jgi:hypothetical protein
MRSLDAILIGAVFGYGAAKIGLDKELGRMLQDAADRRAIRNTEIMLAVMASKTEKSDAPQGT